MKDSLGVIPAQVTSPQSLDSKTQLLARKKLVISFRLCRTAKLDLASAWKGQRSVSHSTTAPMFSTACVSARRRQKGSPLASVFHGWQTYQSSNLSHWMWPTQDSALQLLSDTCAAGQHKTPLLATSDTCCLSKRGGKHARESFSSPRKPIYRMAKAARWISLGKHGGDSPIRSCQICTTAGSMAVELSSRSCRIFQGNVPSGQSRYRMAMPPKLQTWVY